MRSFLEAEGFRAGSVEAAPKHEAVKRNLVSEHIAILNTYTSLTLSIQVFLKNFNGAGARE
jgi:hypothetical protein